MKPSGGIYTKYVVSGGTAALVNLSILYVLTEYGHIHYLMSATGAFIVGMTVSFTLQKYWTFQNKGRSYIFWQALSYMVVSLCGIGFNTICIYELVELLHVWYLFAAVFSGLCIAFVNFFVYRHVIFDPFSYGN